MTATRMKICMIKLLIINYSHALEFVADCCKTQKMCNKAVKIYPYATQVSP